MLKCHPFSGLVDLENITLAALVLRAPYPHSSLESIDPTLYIYPIIHNHVYVILGTHRIPNKAEV